MKVILQKDVAKLGRRHAIVEVPDGYALNRLIPQKLALPASPENLKRIKNIEAEASAHYEADDKAYKEAVAKLSGIKLVLKAEANAQGHLFKAVKASDIHDSLAANGISAIPVEAITIAAPIKSCGEHSVSLHFHEHKDVLVLEVSAK